MPELYQTTAMKARIGAARVDRFKTLSPRRVELWSARLALAPGTPHAAQP